MFGHLGRLAALSTVMGAALVAPVSSPAASAADPSQHVVVIGLDGALYDKIAPANAPRLDAVIAGGYASKTWLYANPMAPTLSGPGWATILSGVWPDKHTITNNSWTSTQAARFPDFLTRVEQAAPSLRTYAAATWAPLTSGSAALVSSAVDKRYASTGDQDTATRTAAEIRATAPHAIFMQLDDIDHAGHDYGSGSQQYLDAISAADTRVGLVLDAVASRPATESWTVIVTADHGHTTTGGHGGSSALERSSFIIKDGPGIGTTRPSIKPRNVDVAYDVLSTLGIAPPSSLDGMRIGAATGDPFDSVVGSLVAQVDETAAPGITGWTRTAPSGWTIGTSGMGTGGVTEWRGWTFTNDDFWTRIAPDQQRETNVRARGVFAVADSDEWADKFYSGTFNSTLTSPSYAVSGRSSVTLRFSSHYRKEGSETAQVRVAFDGGTPTTVLTYSSDQVAKIEQLPISVPTGAQSMKVTFSLVNGNNNWFWAVDDPRVS